jgi:hypothetical protein
MDLENVIYQHLIDQEDSRILTLDKTEEYLADNKAYQNSLQDIENRLKVKLNSGNCSDVLNQQLARHKCNLGERFGDKVEFYNSSEILDIIESIELGKINGEPFNRHEELKDYLHAHHSSYSSLGYSIVRNIKEFWFKRKKIKNELKDEFQQILSKYDQNNIAAIMNTMHTKAIGEKSKNGELKGEWLIYRQYNGCNYYLCLATHKEGDPNIYKHKIIPCITEFPELN